MAEISHDRSGYVGRVSVTRRAAIAGLCSFGLTRNSHAAPAMRRIASLNWALSETLYAIGIRPVCAAEIVGYNRMVGDPPTPPGLVDVGLQSSPNLEALVSLEPDLILIQSWQRALQPLLRSFGRVETFTLFTRGGDAFARAAAAVTRLGDLTGRPQAASALLVKVNETLTACRARLKPYGDRPIYLVQALAPTDLVVFSRGSLFDGAMQQLGLTNAWSIAPNLLWGSTRISVDALAANPDAQIIWIASPDPTVSDQLFQSALWQSLPQAKAGRVSQLPLIWGFGGLPTAERFGKLITSHLLAGSSKRSSNRS